MPTASMASAGIPQRDYGAPGDTGADTAGQGASSAASMIRPSRVRASIAGSWGG